MPHGPDRRGRRRPYTTSGRTLLAPFKAMATPEMMAGATRLYERMDEWHGEVPQAPFTTRSVPLHPGGGQGARREGLEPVT